MDCSKLFQCCHRKEGPLAQDPNSYTNYQTYSNVSTQTSSRFFLVIVLSCLTPMFVLMVRLLPLVPTKGTSEGFEDRNVVVGQTWSTYTEDQQMVFSPKYFKRLAQVSQQSLAAFTSTITRDSEDGLFVPPETPLNDEELNRYLPIFKNLVNLSKLARDFKDGHIVRHSGNKSTQEKVMKGEIKKVVRQVSAFRLV